MFTFSDFRIFNRTLDFRDIELPVIFYSQSLLHNFKTIFGFWKSFKNFGFWDLHTHVVWEGCTDAYEIIGRAAVENNALHTFTEMNFLQGTVKTYFIINIGVLDSEAFSCILYLSQNNEKELASRTFFSEFGTASNLKLRL